MEPKTPKFDVDGKTVELELEAIRNEYVKLSAKLDLIELRSHNIELNCLRASVACQATAGFTNIAERN